jgi:hypothetical protein
MKCNPCNNYCVEQTDRCFGLSFREPLRYIKANNTQSAYAARILSQQHEFIPINDKKYLIKPANNGIRTNCTEGLFILLYQRQNVLIREINTCENNLLFELLCNIKLKIACALKTWAFLSVLTLIHPQCAFNHGDVNSHRRHRVCTIILPTFLLPLYL